MGHVHEVYGIGTFKIYPKFHVPQIHLSMMLVVIWTHIFYLPVEAALNASAL